MSRSLRDCRRGPWWAYLMLLWCMVSIPARTMGADEVTDRYEARVFTNASGETLPYRLLVPPNYDPAQKYPLVLFYHGAGERGVDNEKQLVHGMTDFARDEAQRNHPSFVVAPQCPENQQWVDTPWTADSHQMPAEPTPALRLSLELLDALVNEFSIDQDRLYLTGLSMGGFGVWDALQRYPDRFAAAVPVCGGGDTALAPKIAHVPIWAFHGAKDSVVKPSRSRDMVAALKAAGGMPKYTEYPDVEHNSWAPTYADPKMHAWLFQQRRPE